jgi:hypothetical protein
VINLLFKSDRAGRRSYTKFTYLEISARSADC